MKGKKFLAVIAPLMVAAVCGFSACGGGDDNSEYKVTEEEWIAAFSEDNFKNIRLDSVQEDTIYFENSTEGGGALVFTIKKEESIIIADGIQYTKVKRTAVDTFGENSEVVREYYYTVIDGEEELYEYDENTLAWSLTTIEDTTDFVRFDDMFFSYSNDLKRKYGESTYKEDGYLWTITNEFDGAVAVTNGTIRFKENRISEINGESETTQDGRVSGNGSYTYKFTYGGQSLTLPEN